MNEKSKNTFQFVDNLQSNQSTSSISANQLYKSLKCLRHKNIELLEEKFGYKRSILMFSALLISRYESNIDDLSLWNSYFWKINEERLEKIEFYEELEKYLTRLDSLESIIFNQLSLISKKFLNCMVCQSERVSVLYLPCGHVILCNKCHTTTTSNESHCRLCKTPIEESHTLYF